MSPHELLAQGLTHHRTGRFGEAAVAYRLALDSQPDNAEAKHLLGVLRLKQGDAPAAVEWIQQAIDIDAKVASYHCNLAEALRLAGRLDEAANVCDRALTLQPDYPEAFHNLGVIRFRQRRLDDAERACQRSIQLRPQSAAGHSLLGDILREKGRIRAAVAAYRQALTLDDTQAAAHGNLGLLLVGIGELDEGLRHCRQAVELQPGSALAHGNLGRLLLGRGDIDTAMAELADAIEREPHNAQWCLAVGDAWLELADYDQARGWFERAKQLDPADAEADCRLAALSLEIGDPEAAVDAYRAIIATDHHCVQAHVGLARALLEVGDVQGSVTAHHRSIELRPEWAGLHAALGQTLTSAGDLTGAEECQRKALDLNPKCVPAWAGLATTLGGQTTEAELQHVEKMLTAPWMTDVGRSQLQFGLAAAWDGRGNYDQAIRHLQSANALQKKHLEDRGLGYDPAEHRRYIDRLIVEFSPEYFERVRGFGLSTERPVFIVGMPRSGTTLTEQILASHPLVHGAGERRFVSLSFHVLPQALSKSVSPVECLSDVTSAAVQQLANWHLEQLDRLDSSRAARVVDKMPDNYQLLGWIVTMFPQARIIHCRRDVRDVAVSCWMTHFARINWANDMSHLAQRVANYQRIIAHYRRVLPTPMLEIDYETMVADQKGTSRRLVEFVGMEWNPACLDFHKTERLVRTASVAQVRQPIYKKSVARWKRYETALRPFLENTEVSVP